MIGYSRGISTPPLLERRISWWSDRGHSQNAQDGGIVIVDVVEKPV
jgi:hypothetical protein